MALVLADILELPGKSRLPKQQYLATRQIDYPGFTIGGAAEPLAIPAALLLLILTPAGSVAFWLTFGG